MLSTLILLSVIVVAAACTGSGGSSVAATVGDTEITAADVDAAYARRAEAPSIASELAADSQEADPNLQASVLTALVRTEILRMAAEERGIEITDEQRSEARADVVEQVGGGVHPSSLVRQPVYLQRPGRPPAGTPGRRTAAPRGPDAPPTAAPLSRAAMWD